MNINPISNNDLAFQARIKMDTAKARKSLEKTVTVLAPTALLSTGVDFWNHAHNTSLNGQFDSVYPESSAGIKGSYFNFIDADSLKSHAAPFCFTAMPLLFTGALSPISASALSVYNSVQFNKEQEAENSDRKIPD